jgi:xylan 1,4-beta-xylosidase
VAGSTCGLKISGGCGDGASPVSTPVLVSDQSSFSAFFFSVLFLTLLFITCQFCPAQAAEESTKVRVQVRVDQTAGTMPPIWNYFGYDEPNYSYAPNGKKLLGELAALSPAPVYVRVHNLLTSGDGSSSLKWGSTNVYTEDASGNPVYSWVILDRIFDAFHDAGIKPLVEIGFMPEALSTHPEPYRHDFPRGEIYTGWAYPPKDYQKWSELVFQFAAHLRQRYGDAEVKSWLWEVWNEPDIGYWKGTREEYFKLYDFTAEAVLRALPDAKIGGPETTGPGNTHAAEFLRAFLEHCAYQQNFATGKVGSRLDFISFHPKGSPKWQGDHVQMGIDRQLSAIEQGFKIVASFPEWRDTPIVLGESDPEGCAACSAEKLPQNLYRNGPLYGAYTVVVLNNIDELARREHINFLGAVTWAFEFEDQAPFAGFRELATSGVDKAVLNAFRMLGLMGSERVQATSSGALLSQQIVQAGVRGPSDIGVMAARNKGKREAEVLVWNYNDDDVPSLGAPVEVEISGLPADANRALLEHFRVDSDHGNAFAVWKEIGSPATPSASEYVRLQGAGQLQLLDSPAWRAVQDGTIRIEFVLPRQGLSLLRLTW